MLVQNCHVNGALQEFHKVPEYKTIGHYHVSVVLFPRATVAPLVCPLKPPCLFSSPYKASMSPLSIESH